MTPQSAHELFPFFLALSQRTAPLKKRGAAQKKEKF